MVNIYTLGFALATALLCQASAVHIQNPPVSSHRRSDSTQGNCTSSTCGANIPIAGSQPPASEKGNWLGWGADVYNNRWAASDAVVDSSNIGNLALECSANYTTGLSAAPLVEDGIAYYPTWGGLLVALEYATCTTIWSINITAIITDFKPVTQGVVSLQARSTPVVDGDILYIGTLAQALLLAISKQSGAVLDTLQVDSHPYAILTQSPTFYNGLLYIGTSSDEEAAAAEVPQYQCCSHAGSMNAVAFQENRLSLVWTTPMIPSGSGFSGASIWGSQPAIDPVRKQVFVATGNTYNLPADFQACQNQTVNITVIQQGLTHDPCLPRDVWQESVLALDLATGRVNWVRQLSKLDAWNFGCQPGVVPGGGNPYNCPSQPGPDEDFGMAPTFVPGSQYTPDGLDIIVVGQKNGNLYALTAQAGMVLWTLVTMPGGDEGGFIVCIS
jgi:outer membrane protein assembly factor BamB